MPYFLHHQGDDTPERAPYNSKRAACRAYSFVAEELDRYGQEHTATLHRAPDFDAVAEYPDYVLTLGPRGGIRCERA